jgi:hypothetical protein
LWDEALEEAVQLYRSTPKRTTNGRSSQGGGSQEAWGPGHREAKYPQSITTEQEGCHVGALNYTSTQEVPPTGQPRNASPGSSCETGLVSRYIKEEDEIDYTTEGAVDLEEDGSVTMSTLSIQDQVVDHGEGPLLLTSLSPVNDHFARRSLLGTTVTIDGQEVVALLDSGCEAKLVLSRVFADNDLIQHLPIGRMVGLPDGSQIAASRTEPISLGVAVPRRRCQPS